MKLDRSLCNANVSLTDLIKGWFVALTKQLNAYRSRTLRFASSPVKLVARSPASSMASTNKSLAQMSKTPDHRRRYHERFGS